MKRLLAYLFLVLGLGLVFSVNANSELYISSPELSNLEKVKNIKNKKEKPDKRGVIYVGQKGLVFQNGYGIMEFDDGGVFVGYFHKGDLRDGTWIIKGDVSSVKYEYIKKNKVKKNSAGKPIKHSTTFRPAKEFEIDYIKENVFLKNKISYEEYLKLKGKDKLLVKKESKKENNTNEYKSTGFSVFQAELQPDGITFPYVEAYTENDCLKHGNVKYYNKDTSKPLLSIFGFFEDCMVDHNLSKVSRVYFEKDLKNKYLFNSVFKKDVSHIYGNRPVLGVQISNVVNQKGINVAAITENKPLAKSSIKKGDLIISVNGIKIKSTQQFIQTIRETNKGASLLIKYVSKKNLDKDFNFKNENIKETKISPEYIEEKVALEITHFLKDDYYEEYLRYESGQTFQPWDKVHLTPDSKEWKNRQAILREEFNSLKKYYLSFVGVKKLKKHEYDYEQYYVVSNKQVDSANVSEQELAQLQENKDTKPPVIKVAEKITVKSSSYKITGEVEDDSKRMIYIEVDGIVSATNDGKFTLNRFSPVDEEVSIVAIDQWGNRSEPSVVNVKVDAIKTVVKKLEKLNPSLINNEPASNKVALIIGIENYSNAPKASYANRDAKLFYDYAKRGFGISEDNIKLLIDKGATAANYYDALELWLPARVKPNITKIIVFYSGHGLPSSDAKELYLLAHDSRTASKLLRRTALLRSELFEQINNLKPKSVTMFFDTCFSGTSRDDVALLKDARPINLLAPDTVKVPKNFVVFSSSLNNQISSGFEEAKNGLFSYYLMKGLEGKADKNNDRKITNGELEEYLNSNISKKASEIGREQNSQLVGHPNDNYAKKVLMVYR